MKNHALLAALFCSLILLFGADGLVAQTVEEYTRQASQLIRNHQFKEAIALLETSLQNYPDEPALLVGLGSAFMGAGQAAKGEAVLQKALILQPDNPEALRGAAKVQLWQGKISDAVSLFNKALQHRSDDAESHHQLATAFFLQGDDNRAFDHALLAVQASPFDVRCRLLLGYVARRW